MIEKIFVINCGMCIYEYSLTNEMAIDSQMLSGFLTAIGSFAQETFKSGLSTIQIRNEKKLVFYIEKETSLLFVAISDAMDNNILLDKILAEIAHRFIELKADVLKSCPNHLDKYKDFDDELKILLKNRDKVRNKSTMIRGLFAGVFTLIGLAIAYIIVFASLGLFNDQFITVVSLILFQTIGLSLSAYVSGYVAGTKSAGKKAGIWFYIMVFILIGMMAPAAALILLVFAPLAILVCAAAGAYGGEMCDRKKLYPLRSERTT